MTTARTVIVEAHGGPEAMKLVERELPAPGPGEILIRQKAIGLNFIDVYQRSGLYPTPLPTPLGTEGAGVIEAVGEGVTHLSPGDRAAYAEVSPGSYAEARVMRAAHVVKLPDAIDFDTAAAAMLKGMTTQYLFRRVTPITAGDTVLFHAAAGGVGSIATQWARAEGITLIGTAGSDEKCQMALDGGAAHAINYATEDWVARVRELTGGKGVDVVMDGVGAATFEKSLDCLRPLGFMIAFGNASGSPPPIDIRVLSAKGSLKLTRQTLFHHYGSPGGAQAMAAELFEMITSGKVKVKIGQRYALDEIADAHRALEGRATTGATLITL